MVNMYKNPNLSPEERAADLLSKMTIDEKVNQMLIYAGINDVAKRLKAGEDFPQRGGTFKTPYTDENVNIVQNFNKNNTRLGIPVLVAYEALHGVSDPKGTVFPQCAGLAGSFDPEAVNKMADFIGQEAHDMGIRQVYAPNVDIPRDPRWGRLQETYGEDPYLSGEMGAAYVKGVQKNKVAATMKHFVAYGVGEGGLNLAPAHVGEREIREVMLESFQKCIDAGVLSVMPSYNEIDGIPVHASKKIIRELLRGEMGFDGMSISDYGAIYMFDWFHHTTSDPLTAGKLALEAGIDVEASAVWGYGDELREALKKGEVDIKLVDECVMNVLKLKFRLGLFDDDITVNYETGRFHTDEAVAHARLLDEESILLLENDGILPLDEKKLGKVAVIGNNAKDSFVGDYNYFNDRCVDFYDGMCNRLGPDRVIYSLGTSPISTTDEQIADAIKAAKEADLTFLVLGDCSEMGGGAQNVASETMPEFRDKNKKLEITIGEGFDCHNLKFTPGQQRLFDEITALGKPVILIMYAGVPYAIKEEVKKVNAFMFSFGGGEQSGNAFANLIFGDKSPSAKTAITFPESVGQIPCYYNYKASARGSAYKQHGSIEKPGRDYVLAGPEPWYPFGYGLSYTEVKYSDLTAEKTGENEVKVTVSVENVGNYDVDENVLVFVSAKECIITPFVKRLRAFKKVNLKKGEKKTVEFTLTDKDFTYIDWDMKTAVNRGAHKILVSDLEAEFDF